MSIAALALLVGGWLAFAPTQAGGAAAYIIVDGDSMLPTYANGDLVVTRRAAEYAVGDVVAYRHPDLGPVIHRIIGLDGSRYVLQGDANAWVDDHHPTGARVMGRAWVHLPAAGGLIDELRSGAALVAASTIMGVLIMSLFSTDSASGRSGRRTQARDRSRGPLPRGHRGAVEGPARNVATVVAAVLLASLVLGAAAFGRPSTVPAAGGAGYTHSGTFGYSADAPAGLYDTERVRTGQPVFRRVTDTLTLDFAYRLAAPGQSLDAVHGDYRLRAEVSDPTHGWQRTLVLRPDTPFRGGRFDATADLDLDAVQRLIADMEERTGVQTDRYTLTYRADVSVRGTIDGTELEETFAPRLDFWLDDLLLQLQEPADGTDAARDPVHPEQAGGTTSGAIRPNTLPILGLDVPVTAARLTAVLGAALSAVGLLLTALPLLRALRGDAASRIRVRYGHLLVTVDRPPTPERGTVRVSTMRELVRLADATDRTVLHRPGHAGDDYYVHQADVLYHYGTDHDRAPATVASAEPERLSA